MMKTNKIYIAAATLALGLAACSEQADFTQADVVNAAVENASNAINFDTYIGGIGITRADWDYTGGTITNGDYLSSGTTHSQSLKNAEFGVFSYYTGTSKYTHNGSRPNFMYNEHITWSTSGPSNMWTYSPAKYWPNGIDAANAANDPSNTATEGGAQYLSFFAYAPYAAAKETSGDYPSTAVYGTVPAGATTDYIKTTNYTDARNTTQGVVGMVKNSYQQDPWVNYVMKETNGAATTAATGGIDLLWGLRGQYTYDETDNVDNTVATLGNAYNTNLTKQSVPERVRFLFKHALAKIGGSKQTAAGTEEDPVQSGLWVVVDVDDNNSPADPTGQTKYFSADFSNEKTLVTIKSVKIRDAFTYYQEIDPSGTSAWETSDLNTYGWFNIATGEWKNAGHSTGDGDNATVSSRTAGGATFNLTINNDKLNPKIKELANTSDYVVYASKADGKKNTASGDDTWDTSVNPVGALATSATKVYSNQNNEGVMLIPGSSPQYVYVTVDYVVRTADKKLDTDGDGKKKWTEVEQIITNKVGLANLEANKFYGLLMHLGLTSVKFEAIVADWAGTSDAVFDENGEVIEGSTTNTQKVWLPSNVVNTTTIYADAGTKHKKVTVADTQTTYEINLTGLTPGKTLEVTGSGTGYTSAAIVYGDPEPDPNVIQPAGTAKVTVTMAANTTTADRDITVTIKEVTTAAPKTYNDANETVVTITQTKSVLVLTPSVTSIGPSGSFELKATHTNGTDFNLNGYNYKISIDGVAETGDGTTISSDVSTVTITPATNTTNAPRTITVAFTKASCASDDTTDTPVIQAPAE